ncbi:thyrotropin-releasing hormone receptor [Linepithema humile]|uniref:thyrotropin-releasing hormone receptor n=1 Tax=Linepithema humile TaxID=83485 RepID=UPI0006239CD4|nr:PREDICTED: thyrotropin-releasing hormone receptor-like [Linepithema humile]
MNDEGNSTLHVVEHIKQYYIPTFLWLCVLGNVLCVCVLLGTKLRYNSSSIYLGALAMSDSGVLTAAFLMWLGWMQIIHYKVWLYVFLFGLRWLFCFLSIWIVVAFTVQRYVVIKWPLLRRSWCTVSRAKTVVIGLLIFAIIYATPWLIIQSLITLNFDLEETHFEKSNLTYWWTVLLIIDAILTLVLPITMIVSFNTLIVCAIRKQNRVRENLFLTPDVPNERKLSTASSASESNHIKVTKMLVIISSIFICLNAPIHISSFLHYYDINADKYVVTFLRDMISYVFCLTNHGINFILYYATGENFRKEVIRICTKCSDTKKGESVDVKSYEK